jgi:hypothetical protein
MAEGRRGLFLERLVVDPPDLADKRAEKEALPLATSAVDDSYPWAGGWALSESKEVAPLVVAIEEALGSKLVHSVPSEVVTGLTVTRPTTMSRSTQRPCAARMPDGAYEDAAEHGPDREIRWRVYDAERVEIVVDLVDDTIVSVWITQVNR